LNGSQTPNRLLYVDQSGLINISNPSISGIAEVGEVMSADVGVWDSGTTFAYQWNRVSGTSTSLISGATQSSYTLDASDLGQTVTVTVIGSNSGASAIRTSAASATIQKGTQRTSAQPKIAGSLAVGQNVSVDVTEFKIGSTFTFEWFVDNVSVTSPTAGQLRLEGANLGKKLSLKVTADLAGYKPYIVSIDAKDPIAPGTFVAKATPTITGLIKALETVKVTPGTWDEGVALTYQWAIDGQSVDAAIAETFKLPRESVGKTVTVTVTGSKLGYVTESITSIGIAVAPLTFVKAPIPTIKGTAVVGKKLTAYIGTWDDGTSITYQWKRNGVAIKGATRGTYVLTKADLGKLITIAITGNQQFFTPTTKTSKATARVK
jgi:hypothetical protein